LTKLLNDVIITQIEGDKMENGYTTTRTQNIKCVFCYKPSSVFSTEDGVYACNHCNAEYFPIRLPNVDAEKVVIQDWAIAHDDPAMGCKIVFGQQGDISRNDADLILMRDEELSKGFTKLSPNFSQYLWYSSEGNAKIDAETIRDVCRKFAIAYTGENEDSILTIERPSDEVTIRVSFGRKVAHRVDINRLAENHKRISSIPRNNDNLIRYFVAEGQEKLIVMAAKRAYDNFMSKNKPDLLGAELCKAICV